MVFGKGDIVRVARIVWTQEGWTETWTPQMVESKDKVLTVTDTAEGHGVQLDNEYWYPASALEMVYH